MKKSSISTNRACGNCGLTFLEKSRFVGLLKGENVGFAYDLPTEI